MPRFLKGLSKFEPVQSIAPVPRQSFMSASYTMHRNRDALTAATEGTEVDLSWNNFSVLGTVQVLASHGIKYVNVVMSSIELNSRPQGLANLIYCPLTPLEDYRVAQCATVLMSRRLLDMFWRGGHPDMWQHLFHGDIRTATTRPLDKIRFQNYEYFDLEPDFIYVGYPYS